MSAVDPGVQADLDQAFALVAQARFADAAALLAGTCERAPDEPRPWLVLGAARHQAGELAGALAAFDRALELAPDSVETLRARCAVLHELGRADEAMADVRRGLELAPRDAMLLTNLAILLEGQGQAEQALAVYDEALAADPDWLPALLNRGALLGAMGRHGEALADAEQLVQMAPGLAEPRLNRAEALLALERFEEALEAAEQALMLRPGWDAARRAQGSALAALGRIEHAQRAYAGLPDAPDARVVYLNRGAARQVRCDWSDRGEFVARFEAMVHAGEAAGHPLTDPSLAFVSLALPLRPETRVALMRGISAGVVQRAVALPAPQRGRAPGGAGRLRLGYLSGSIYRHPNAYQTRFLYRMHDRERFEVHCFSMHPGDGSAVRREIERNAEHFHHLAGRGPDQVAQAIADAGIEVLVDLNGYTRHAQPEVLALRPAPVQAIYLGFPCSSGAPFVDYFVSDAVVAPPGEEDLWSEALVRLPGCCYPYNDTQPVATAARRAEYGLPEAGFVFCAFNAAYKIEPGGFAVWMRLLRRVPGSVLWLMSGGPDMEANLRREAAAAGVDPQRLVFADFLELAEHLVRYTVADLFLDTFVCNAHTTACDALWAGLPVLTAPGDHMVSRVAASAVLAAGLPELVADGAADYEERAFALASQPEALRALRSRLAQARAGSALFDSERYLRGLEWAYQAMWARHEAGGAPAALTVPGG